MKGSGKIILALACLTSFMVLYIHGQIMLFDLSYLIDQQNTVIAESTENYHRVKFDVERLKAPHRLEAKMKEFSFDLTLPDQIHVLKVPPARPIPAHPVSNMVMPSVQNRVLDFFGKWIGVAQAHTDS